MRFTARGGGGGGGRRGAALAFAGTLATMAAAEASESSEGMSVLVTGGSGLVGRAVKAFVEAHGSEKETWFFAGSKDGDLR